MKIFSILGLALLGLGACAKENPHDNYRVPAPSSNAPAQNHRFDGGESDPYSKPGEGAGEGGDKAAPAAN